MEIGNMCISVFLGIIKAFLRVVFKIVVFTGIWISFLLIIGIDKVVNLILDMRGMPEMITTNYPNFEPVYEWVLLIISLIPAIYITLRNLIRLFTQKADFSLFVAITGRGQKAKERKAVNPGIPKEYFSTTATGFLFGKKNGGYVVKPEDADGHILVIGGAGSGKSSCIAIPSLLSWRERIFAIDIKGELSQKTAHAHPAMKVFNPGDPGSHGYDPFYILADSRDIVQDIMQIAFAIVPLPENVKEPYFINGARNYFTGAMVYFYEQGRSFIETIEAIQMTPAVQLIEDISESSSNRAKLLTNQFVGAEARALADIFTTLSNHIMIFATDQEVRAALSKRDIITPNDLESGYDVFISIEESKLDIWKNLLSLIVNQFLKHFERRPDEGATPILFLLDEFARLGKIESIIHGLATLRSKKITICPIIQSLAQLDAIYGKEQRRVIADNCQFKAILNATDADTQDYFSRLVGTYDKMKKSRNSNFEQYTGLGKGRGTGETTEEKRIVKPEDFGSLKDIIILSPKGYFRIDKHHYLEK